MVNKNITIGFLAFIITSTAILITMQDSNLRIDVRKGYTDFQIYNGQDWITTGRETIKLYNGTNQIIRNTSSTFLLFEYFNETNTSIITRSSNYGKSTITETYQFRSDLNDKTLFPVKHEIKVINGEGLILQYEASKISYNGPSQYLTGNSISLGYNMKVEWDEGFKYARIRNGTSPLLTIKYDILSNISGYNIRLFDPAANLYVNKSHGSCSNAYNRSTASNIATPWCNLTAPLNNDLMLDGDTLYIAAGEYHSNTDITSWNLTSNTTIISYPGDVVNITGYTDDMAIETIDNGVWTNRSSGVWDTPLISTTETSYPMVYLKNNSMFFTVSSQTDLMTCPFTRCAYLNTTPAPDRLTVKFNDTSTNPNNISIYMAHKYDSIYVYNLRTTSDSYLLIKNITFKYPKYSLRIRNSSNVIIENNNFYGGLYSVYIDGDNVVGLSNIIIRNNYLEGLQEPAWAVDWIKDAATMETDSVRGEDFPGRVEVYNNVFNHSSGGVSLYADSQTDFNNSVIYNNTAQYAGGSLFEIEDYCSNSKWYENKIINCSYAGVSFAPAHALSTAPCNFSYNIIDCQGTHLETFPSTYYDGWAIKAQARAGTNISNWIIDHNTFAGKDRAINTMDNQSGSTPYTAWVNTSFTNNIFYATDEYVLGRTGLAINGVFYNHNLYYEDGAGIFAARWNTNDATTRNTLAIALASADWDGTWDINSTQSNPLLTNYVPSRLSPACNTSSSRSYVGAVPCSTSPATFHFCSNGSDTSTTANSSAPLKTINRLNDIVLIPGDNVSFCRGGTWRQPDDDYIVLKTGNLSFNTTYKAYGSTSLSKPLFLGSINASSTANWTGLGSNIWLSTQTSTREIANLIFNNEVGDTGWAKRNKGNVTSQGDFWYNSTNDKVYLYSTSNPGSYYSVIEMARERVIFDEMNYLTNVVIDGLDLRYGYMGMALENSSYIFINGTTIKYIGGSYQYSTGTTRFGNGIQMWENDHHIFITHNNISQIFDAGITPQYIGGTASANFSDILISHNILSDMRYCYEITNYNRSSVTRVTLDHETCVNTGGGWSARQLSGSLGERKRSVFIGAVIGTLDYNNITVQNSIFYNTTDNFIYENSGCNESQIHFNWNFYYTDNTSAEFAYWELQSYNMSYYTAFKGNENQELNGSFANPLFIPGTYTPANDSPACTNASDGNYIGYIPCATSTNYTNFSITGITVSTTTGLNNTDADWNSSIISYGEVDEINYWERSNTTNKVLLAYSFNANNTGVVVNHGSLGNGTAITQGSNNTWVSGAGIDGSGAWHTGGNKYINTTSNYNMVRPFTACINYKPDYFPSSGNNWGLINDWDTNSLRSWMLYLAMNSSVAYIRAASSHNGATITSASYIIPSYGVWYDVCGVFESGRNKLYINGVNVANVTLTNNTLHSNNAHILINCWTYNGSLSSCGNSSFDNVMIYNYSVSSEQLLERYNARNLDRPEMLKAEETSINDNWSVKFYASDLSNYLSTEANVIISDDEAEDSSPTNVTIYINLSVNDIKPDWSLLTYTVYNASVGNFTWSLVQYNVSYEVPWVFNLSNAGNATINYKFNKTNYNARYEWRCNGTRITNTKISVINVSVNESVLINCSMDLNISQTIVNWTVISDNANWTFNYTAFAE